MLKKMTECARSAVMLDREISKYVDIFQRDAQVCTLSPILFKVYVNGMTVAVEAEGKESRWEKIRCRGRCLRMVSWGYQKHPTDCRNR